MSQNEHPELPGWDVRVVGDLWYAASPAYDLDGLVIHGRSVAELLWRVRVQVGVEALAMGRQGRRPPGGVLCGVDFSEVLEPVPSADPEAFVGPSPSEIHRIRHAPMPQGAAAGYLGDPCPECQAMTLVRNGSCLKCLNCGSTTGCS